ncbi:MAG: DUF3073 domain-containing protein [Candidatus Nanopelagicales bacterium]|jgi:hypothetical protein
MGRGRQKAKQAKVARALKYETPDMDLKALQAELAGSKPAETDEVEDVEDEEYEDEWDDEDEEER